MHTEYYHQMRKIFIKILRDIRMKLLNEEELAFIPNGVNLKLSIWDFYLTILL